MGSLAISSRAMNPINMTTATTASITIIVESNQSLRSPRSRTSCRQPNPITISAMPARSTCRGRRWKGASKRNALIMKKPMMPMGRLM